MMINSVPGNGKLPPELAIAQRARQKYRLPSRKCDPIAYPFRSAIAYPFRSAIAYPLGSATYRLHSRKCDRLGSQKCDRVASECDVSPTFSEVRSRSVPARSIAYRLASAIAYILGSAFAQRARQKYRLPFRKCVRILPESDR
ncbi:hypothetical protein, partial [Arthrospira sp. PCC 8006]|uniref:hypothetical protein n=1 Tax=Arthrospira sp. PCC 8006 TaxID=1982224 RepID=UPI00396F38D4